MSKNAIYILVLIHVFRCLFYEEIDSHMVDKKERKIIVCGHFRPSDIAIKLQKRMKRRVEILEVEDLAGGRGGGGGGQEQEPPYEPTHEYSPQSDHMTTPLLC